MTSRFMKIMGLCLVAAFVMSAVAASAALAAGGPLWIVGAGKTSLAAGETRKITSRNEGIYKLKTVGSPAVECEPVENSGVILGGNPGTAYTSVVFKKCHLEKKPGCLATGIKPLKAANPGEVVVDALAVLAYPVGNRESALLAFAPEGEAANTALFVEFELFNENDEKGEVGECGKLNEKFVKVESKTTSSTIKIKSEERRCGQLAEVGHTVEGSFVLSKPGEVASVGLLRLPATAITEAEVWNPGTAKFETIKCELETKGGIAGKANEVGTSIIETVPAEAFGWDA